MENTDLPSGYTYKVVPSEQENVITFRIKEVNSQESAETWFVNYGETSYSTWRVSETFPRSGRINCFKKKYRCQHNVCYPRVTNPKRIVVSKNTNCPALLTLTVKRFVKNSRSKNPDYQLNQEWPCIVEFCNHHNHDMMSASVLKYRPMNSETKNKLITLFRKGHSVASALNAIKLNLYLEKGEYYYLYAADGHFVPTSSQVQYLYNKEFADTYGNKSSNLKEDLEASVCKLSKKYNELGGRIKYTQVEGHNIIAICTPLMTRVHQMIQQSAEMIFVDAAGGMDKLNSRVYFFMAPSVAGALPIGVIITDAESKSVFTIGLKELLKCFPTDSFFGKGFPSVILTDDDMKERDPLQTIFAASTLLLCQFHVLKAVWRWILSARNKIPSEHRQELYMSFKYLVYELDIETLHSRYNLFLENCKYSNFKTYIAQEKWPRVEEWASAYRQKFLIRGNNTTNYVEVAFRLMKDVILDRVKAYNMVQLLDFIATNLELYYEQRCLDFANGRYCKKLLNKFLSITSNIDPNQIMTLSDDLYRIPSENQENVFYTVCTKVGCCSCQVGITGKLCKHLSLILTHFKLEDNFYIVCEKTKLILFRVSTNRDPPEGWLTAINSNVQAHSNKERIETTVHEENKEFTEVLDFQGKKKEETIPIQESFHENINKKQPELSSNALETLDSICERIKKGVSEQGDIFIPALNKMVLNYESFAKTDHGLISSMYAFGKQFRPASCMTERRGLKIHPQPTSIARRKYKHLALGGTKSGRPINVKKTLQKLGHDYTNMGSLPARKRKVPHSLQEAVFQNKNLN